jgi:hypothetical protein
MTFDIHNTPMDPETSEYDDEALSVYMDTLMDLFAESPEGQAVIQQYGQISWTYTMMEYGVSYTGVLPPDMIPDDVAEIVFDVFPQKVSTDTESLPGIFAELRAFWQFLKREFNLENADECLQVLDKAGEDDFIKAMNDPSQYGMAKSMVMQGIARGYDMTNEQQMNEWMQIYNEELMRNQLPPPGLSNLFGLRSPAIPSLFGLPSPPSFSPSIGSSKHKADKSKKAKRKMQQASKKKNRKRK